MVLTLTPRYLLKCAASLLATLLGALLLLADGADTCDGYVAFRASFDFTSDCPHAPSQGHLLLDFPAQGKNGQDIDRRLAEEQLAAAGLSTSAVTLEFDDICPNDSQGRITGIAFSLGSSGYTKYWCEMVQLPLPVTGVRTVTCHRAADAAADSRQGDAGVTEGSTCSIALEISAK